MKIERLEIADILLVTPARHGDPPRFFSETFRADAFADATFVQDNHAFSALCDAHKRHR
jgi:dTDP-4-dehydrorhamnose 3,5-epimerase